MRLNEIPSDLIGHLSSFVDGLSLVELWKCGDKRLNQLLSVGVESFEVVWNGNGVLKWPAAIVAQFRSMSSLTVVPSVESMHITVSRFDVKQIPSSIRRLKLHFQHLYLELVDPPCRQPIHLLTEVSRTDHSPLDLSTLFPELVSLHLTGNHIVTPFPFLRLPTQLKELTIKGAYYFDEWNDVSALPSTLELCDCAVIPLAPNIANALPSLLTLRVNTTISSDLHLPSTLEHLTIYGGEWKELDCAALPRGLKTLFAFGTQLPLRNLEELPVSMTSFRLVQSYSGSSVSSPSNAVSWAKVFQRTPLRSLALDSEATLDWISHECPRLPSTLTELQIPHAEFAVPDIFNWSEMAPNLTSLDFGRVFQSEDNLNTMLAQLPVGLRVLKLEKLGNNDALQRLTRLELLDVESISKPLSFAQTAALSRVLQQLLCRRGTLFTGGDCFKALPNSLTQLYAEQIGAKVRRDDLQGLPASLTSLALPATLYAKTPLGLCHLTQLKVLNCTIPNLGIDPADATYDPVENPLASFPVLEHLTLINVGSVDNSLLDRLPASLRVLIVWNPFPTLLQDSDLDRLPHLTYLELPESPRLTQECIQHLPKTLTWNNIRPTH